MPSNTHLLKQEKVNSLLRKTISSFIAREISGAIITVMRINTSKDLKLAKIFVSIFPENKEKTILAFLKEKTGELRKFIGSQIKMKFLPRFQFEIDYEEKKRISNKGDNPT